MNWLKGYMARRAEDMMRRMAGMPSRKEEQRRARKARASRKSQAPADDRRDKEEAIRSMRENAVDVEFTEIKEYSSEDIIAEDSNGNRTVYHEEQVTDAEFTEIKNSQK